MSDERARRSQDVEAEAAEELHEGARPTTNQPLNAEPRPRLTPLVLVVVLLAVVVVVFLALTLV
jgi:hypothetical protein